MERTDVLKEIEDVMGQEIKQSIGKLNNALNHAHGELSKDVREYDRGLEDAWELAKKIATMFSTHERAKIFGYVVGGITVTDILRDFTPQEALAKVKEYEEKQEEIEVGDVLLGKFGMCVVTKIRANNTFYGFFRDGSSGIHCKENFKKTGKHIDIQSILDEIGKEGE